MDKVLISISAFGECGRKPVDLLEKTSLVLIRNTYGRRLQPQEVIDLGKDCIGMLAGLETLDEKVLTNLPRLKVISRIGTGIDNIDLEAAKRLKIAIYNTPDAPTQAVAELAVGLMLDLLRKISMMDRRMRQGGWKRSAGNIIKGKTIGIIGLGRIGKRVAELLQGLGALIIACDIVQDSSFLKGKDIKMVGMEKLLKNSDIVSLHLSGTDCVIGNEEINMMKNSAYIINLSRGGILDETALYNALKDGRIAGAALDVFREEPYEGPLKELDNVILTPHIGSLTRESRAAMETEAVNNLLAFLKTGGGDGGAGAKKVMG